MNVSKYRRQPDASGRSQPFLQLNISGRKYDIPEFIARSHIGSIFALLVNRGQSDWENDELEKRRILATRRIVLIQDGWFIERTPTMFEIILQYLYTRQLHCPSSVCEKAVQDELKFWKLGNVPVGNCCGQDDEQGEEESDEQGGEEEEEYEETEESEKLEESTPQMQGSPEEKRRFSAKRLSLAAIALKDEISGKRRRWKRLNRIIWRLCHGPSSWKPAKIFNGLCIFFIVISCLNLILNTIPELQCSNLALIEFNNISINNSSSNDTKIQVDTTQILLAREHMDNKFIASCASEMAFDIIEVICIAWFTLELILRFISFPQKCQFFKSPLNIIDILATAPYYIELLLRLFGSDLDSFSTLMVVLRILRIFRIFRIFRLARYFKSLKMFGTTVSKSREELGILSLFLIFSMVIFASIMYHLEKDVPGTPYTSIPASFYWAVVTLTTTGYGDVTPSTALGKSLAGLACVTGILILAFPVSILVEHFTESYKARKQRRRRYLEQKRANEADATDFQYSEYNLVNRSISNMTTDSLSMASSSGNQTKPANVTMRHSTESIGDGQMQFAVIDREKNNGSKKMANIKRMSRQLQAEHTV